jgi:hypothetical protein
LAHFLAHWGAGVSDEILLRKWMCRLPNIRVLMGNVGSMQFQFEEDFDIIVELEGLVV